MAAWRTSLTIPFSLEEDLLLLSHLSNTHHLFIFPPSSSSHLHSNRLLPRKGDGGEQQHGSLLGEETRHREGHGASDKSEKNERAFLNSMYSTPSTDLKTMTSSLEKCWFPMSGSHNNHINSSSQPLPPNTAKGGSSTSSSHSSSCDCSVEDWLVFIAKHDLHHRDVTSLQKRIRVLHRFSLRIASSSSSSIPSSSSSTSSSSSSSSSSFSRFLSCSSTSKLSHAGGLAERFKILKKSQRKEEQAPQHTAIRREGVAGSAGVYSGELSSGGSQGRKESGGLYKGEEQRLRGNDEKEDGGEGERRIREEEEWSSRDNDKERRQGRHVVDVIEEGMREQERGREGEKDLHTRQRDRRDEVSFSTLASTFSSCSSGMNFHPQKEQHTSLQTLPQQTCLPKESQGTLSSGHTTASSSSFSSSSLSSSSSLPQASLLATPDHPLSPEGDTSPERGENQDCDSRNGSLHGDAPKEMKASPSPLSKKSNPLLALLSPALMKWSSDETRALLNTRHPHTSILTRDLESHHTGSPPILPKIHPSPLSSPASARAGGAISSSFLSSSSSSLTPPPSFSSSSSSSSPSLATAPEISSTSLLPSSSSPTPGAGLLAVLPSSSSTAGIFSLPSLSAVCLEGDKKRKGDIPFSQNCPSIRTHPIFLSSSQEEKKTLDNSSSLSTAKGPGHPPQAWPSLSHLSHEDPSQTGIERDSPSLHEKNKKDRKDMRSLSHGGGEEHTVSRLSGEHASVRPLEDSHDKTSLSPGGDQDMLAQKKRKLSEGGNEERLLPEEKEDNFSGGSREMAYITRTTSSDDQRHPSHSSSFVDLSQPVSFHGNRYEGEKEPHVFTSPPLADHSLYNETPLNGQKGQEISSHLLVHRAVSPTESSDLHPPHVHTRKLDGEGDTRTINASPQPLPSASHAIVPRLCPSPSSSYHYHQHYHRASRSTDSQVVDVSSSHLESRLLNHPQQETGNGLNRSLLEKNQYENLLFLEMQEKNLLHCQLPYFGGVHDTMKKSLSPSLSSYDEREKSSYASIDPSQDTIHKALHPAHPLVHVSLNDSSPAKLHGEKSSLVEREEHLCLSPPSLSIANKKDEKAALSSSSPCSHGDLHANQKDFAVGVDPIHQETERREECCCAQKRLSEEKTASFNADERREEGHPGGEEEMSIMKQPREEKGKEGEKLRDLSHVALSSDSSTTLSSSERGRKEKEEDLLDRTAQGNDSSHTSHHKAKEPGGEGEGGERDVSSPEGKIKKNGSSSSSSTTSKGLHSKLRNRNLICAPFYQDVTSIAEALDDIPCDFFLDSINCGIPPAMVNNQT